MLINAMKNTGFALYFVLSLLSGCGQPGPLYLPTSKPPMYVEPEPETKDAASKQETKPQPPPQPEIKPPATEQ
jgi:predicted small lipoprotein YifL